MCGVAGEFRRLPALIENPVNPHFFDPPDVEANKVIFFRFSLLSQTQQLITGVQQMQTADQQSS